MSQENVEAVRRALDGWNRGDVDAWVESAHPDIEWFSAIKGRVEGDNTVYRGVAETRRFWDEWHAIWELTIELSDIRDLGDTVLALGRMQARGDGSGIDIESPIGYVFEFEGGVVRRARSYLNPRQALEAVGLRE